MNLKIVEGEPMISMQNLQQKYKKSDLSFLLFFVISFEKWQYLHRCWRDLYFSYKLDTSRNLYHHAVNKSMTVVPSYILVMASILYPYMFYQILKIKFTF